MKKKFAILLVFAMLFSLTACGTNSGTAPTTTSKQQETTTRKTEDLSSQNGETANQTNTLGTGVMITIYTNSGSDGRGEWLTERAAQDGFRIQFIDAGAAEVQNRLLAEKNAPIADVVYGLNSIIWESLKTENILVPYTPVWASEVSEGLNDPEGYYHAIVKQAILLVHDKKQVADADAPSDWIDLWTNEAFDGKYQYLTSLAGGTVRNVLAGILTRYADPAGDLGISDEGWEQIAQYYQHGVPVESGKDLYANIADTNDPVQFGQMWSSGIETRDEQYGTETGYAIPEVGVPYAVESVAIVNGTKNEEEAQRFVDWFGSAQIQGEWAKQFSTLPANQNAVDQANEFNQEIAKLPSQNIDWALVAKNIDAWCEKIELNYIP